MTKKLILFPLLAFLLSLGGTSAFLVKTRKPELVAVDSLSAPHDTAATDSMKLAPSGRDSVVADTSHAAVRPDSTVGRSHAANPAAEPAGTGPAAPVAPPAAHIAPQADPAARAVAYKQVARVLSAMKPAEAAKVLAYLSDDEVEGILRAVGPRQAADFLSNIPKERAAGLSRRLLVPKEPGR